MDHASSLSSLKETLQIHPLFAVGIFLLVGYLMGQVAAKVKLPEVTGYILAGLFLGDSMTQIVHRQMSDSLSIVTDLALGLIALTVGSEFYHTKIKTIGKEVIIITVLQILLTFGAVTLALFFFSFPLAYSLLLGAIATATAPAATVAVVQSLRAKGPFIDRLYGVIALDDAGCIALFGLVFAVASGLIAPEASLSIQAMTLSALGEIFFSILAGILAGLLIHFLIRGNRSSQEILLVALGVILIGSALAIALHLSLLLSNMAAGATLVNLSPRNHRVFRIIQPLTPPIYALFFVIAGAELNPSVIAQGEVLLLGSVFIIFRAVAKYGGVYLGAAWAGSDRQTKNYLGLCMLPEAGVAIGLVLVLQASPLMASLPPEAGQMVNLMVNIVLLAVFVNALIGPPASKYAIIRAQRKGDRGSS